ncbi:MAG: hypothetical protein WC829_17270 [Hyphomicrobium sp.]|jgi:hypothetical protein
MATYQAAAAKANSVAKFNGYRQPKTDDAWLGFYPFGFAEDDAREYASGRRIPDADRKNWEDWAGDSTDRWRAGFRRVADDELESIEDPWAGIPLAPQMWCRICTALPDEVAECGARLARGDVPIRVAYRAPIELEPSGTFHVGLFIVSNPDTDELDELTVESPNSFLAPLGLYWDHSPRPEPIRGLKRCFKLTRNGWEEHGPSHQRAARSAGFSATSDCGDFELAFEAAAGGGDDAKPSAVRDAFIARRPGTPAAKRGAWFRSLDKARVAGYLITDDLISRSVRRSANASERERLLV